MLDRPRDSWLLRPRSARPDPHQSARRTRALVLDRSPVGGEGFDAEVVERAPGAAASFPQEGMPILVLTFRGVPVQEETLQYVRRCCRRAQAELALGVALVDVVVERCEGGAVCASITLGAPPVLRVEDRDLDELLAIQNAFARLYARRA